MNRFLTLLMMGALASFSLTGCDDDEKKPSNNDDADVTEDASVDATADAPATVESGVIVIHAASAFGEVNVYANDDFSAPVDGLTDLAYSETTATKKVLPPGEYKLQLVPASVEDPTVDDVIASRSGVAVTEGNFTLVVALGDDAEGGVGIGAWDSFAMTPGEDEAVVRVVHGSQQAGEVDIVQVVDEAADTPLIEDFTFGEVAELAIPAATEIVVGADVNNNGEADVAFTVPAALPAGAKATAIVVNAGDTFKLLVNVAGTTSITAISQIDT